MFQKQPLEVIRELLTNLPEKDGRLAKRFLEKRDFRAIHELVVSDIYLIEKNAVSPNPHDKYDNIDYDKLVELKSELEEYMGLLVAPDDFEDLFYD